MVRRLDPPSRWDDLGKYMEDHRMDVSLIASVGIDLGKTTFHHPRVWS
jgi:peptidoglycan/xylan/chitin deacetylase (PgdA/CDA1 family)